MNQTTDTINNHADAFHETDNERKKKQIREKIAERAYPYINRILRKVNTPSGIEYDYDDLRQECFYMVFKALNNYDPSMDNKFSTFMYIRVRGYVIDFLRKHDPLSRGQRNKVGEVKQVRHELEQAKGEVANVAEIAEEMGTSKKEVINALRSHSRRQKAELDSEVSYHITADDDSLETKFDRSLLIRKLNTLSVRDRVLLLLGFFYDLTAKQIGKVFGLSQNYVYKLKYNALKSLN